MKYSRNRSFARKAVDLTKVRAALRTTAHEIAPLIEATTSVSERGGWSTGDYNEPGATKRSTRVESGHRSNDGRVAVRIVQDFAVVAEEFRQNRDHMLRAASGKR